MASNVPHAITRPVLVHFDPHRQALIRTLHSSGFKELKKKLATKLELFVCGAVATRTPTVCLDLFFQSGVGGSVCGSVLCHHPSTSYIAHHSLFAHNQSHHSLPRVATSTLPTRRLCFYLPRFVPTTNLAQGKRLNDRLHLQCI